MILQNGWVIESCSPVCSPVVQTWADKLGLFQNNFTEIAIAIIVAMTVVAVVETICQSVNYQSNNAVRMVELEFEEADEE